MTDLVLPTTGQIGWGDVLNAALQQLIHAVDGVTLNIGYDTVTGELYYDPAGVDPTDAVSWQVIDNELVFTFNESVIQLATQAQFASYQAVIDAALTNSINQAVAAVDTAGMLMKWKANTAYVAGQTVLNPSGELVKALANFTSGSTYSATNWSPPASATFRAKAEVRSSDARADSVFVARPLDAGDVAYRVAQYGGFTFVAAGTSGGSGLAGKVLYIDTATNTLGLGYDTGEQSVRALVPFAGNLYAGTGINGKVYKFNGTTWSLVYTGTAGESIRCGAVVGGTTLYMGESTTGKVYKTTDGTTWTLATTLPDTSVESLLAIGSTLFIGGSNPSTAAYHIYKWDGTTRTLLYTATTANKSEPLSLASFGGQLAVSEYDPTGATQVTFVDTTTGAATHVNVGSSTETALYSLAVIGSTLYIGAHPTGNLYAWDGTTMRLAATVPGVLSLRDLAVDGTNLLIAGRSSTAAGGSLWKFDGTNLVASYFHLSVEPAPLHRFRGALATIAVSVSIPGDATNIVVDLATEVFDTDTIHDPGTPSRLTVPAGLAGVWRLTAQGKFDGNSNGRRSIQIIKNGNVVAQDVLSAAPTYDTTIGGLSAITTGVAGDYFQLRIWQDSGVALNAQDTYTWLAAEFIGTL